MPVGEKGQVLLIRNIKAADFNRSVNGCVYQGKLEWIGYDPQDGIFFNPAYDASVNSWEIDPLHKAQSRELDYMIDLSCWWQAVNENHGAIQIQVKNGQEHRNIGDVNTNVFFDATVEVIVFPFECSRVLTIPRS